MMIIRLYPVMTTVAVEICSVDLDEPTDGEPRSRLLHREYVPEEQMTSAAGVSEALYRCLSTMEGYASESTLDLL